MAGLLYTPVIILVFFVVALLAVKRLCSKKGISLARFAVALSALELVLFILVPGNCIAVSLLAKRLINKFSFLKEQFASLAILCANLLYPGCFYYSWNNMIWDEIYGLPLNMPAMWQVLLAVQAVWSIVLMIKLIYTVINNKAKSEGK